MQRMDDYGRDNASIQQQAPKKDPYQLCEEDLRFLVHNRVALRYQSDAHHQKFLKEGGISGDAYSIGYPAEWYPPSPQKCRDFATLLLIHVVERVLESELPGREGGGKFLLFTDIDGARNPVRNRAGYPDPFYAVGAGTHFPLEQQIGSVDVAPDPAPRRQLSQGELKEFERIKKNKANELVQSIIEAIDDARKMAPDQSAEMAAEDEKYRQKQTRLYARPGFIPTTSSATRK